MSMCCGSFGQRYPHDYNKLPFAAYWLLHLVWLFPWSLFLPALIAVAWKTRHHWLQHLRHDAGATVDFYLDHAAREDVASFVQRLKFRVRTVWLLSIFSAFSLLFFSISTNQEYYTFPVWPPLFILIAGVIAGIEEKRGLDGTPDEGANSPHPLLSTRWLTGGQAVFAGVGVLAAAALAWGLWDSRNLPYVADVGTVLAHRGVGDYTLSMSHFFDLTGASFAALRLPAALAAVACLSVRVGWILRLKGKQIAATVSLALTSAVFLVAAHIAFARFDPMLGSKQLADTIIRDGSPADSVIIYGEQSDASSIVFYTHKFFAGKPAFLVLPRCGQHGEGTPLLWGSCYPDAPNIFLSDDQLSKEWGTGERKWLFAQDINQQKAESLLAGRLYPVQSLADKELVDGSAAEVENQRCDVPNSARYFRMARCAGLIKCALSLRLKRVLRRACNHFFHIFACHCARGRITEFVFLPQSRKVLRFLLPFVLIKPSLNGFVVSDRIFHAVNDEVDALLNLDNFFGHRGLA
jgi:hypothetical protein